LIIYLILIKLNLENHVAYIILLVMEFCVLQRVGFHTGSDNHLTPADQNQSVKLVVEAKGFRRRSMALDTNCEDQGYVKKEIARNRSIQELNWRRTGRIQQGKEGSSLYC
jgi:hypothetical protein